MSVIEENCDNMTQYSESVVTVDSDPEIDDTASTITEGSEWGDQFVPWELKVSTQKSIRLISLEIDGLNILFQVDSNQFTVRDLVTMNKEYQFRVVAVNEAGRSRPSKPSDTVQPKPEQNRPGAPRALSTWGNASRNRP